MNKIQVKTIQTPILQTPLTSRSHMFLAMKRIPKFTSDEQLFPLHQPFFDRTSYTGSAFGLVAVVGCTVEQSVAGSDGGVDGVGGDGLGDFPEAHADEWHRVRGGRERYGGGGGGHGA